jgi:hypothetical protein
MDTCSTLGRIYGRYKLSEAPVYLFGCLELKWFPLLTCMLIQSVIRGVHAQGRDVNLHEYRNADKTSCTVAIKMIQYKCILNGVLIFVELPTVIFWRCIQHFSSCYICTAGQSSCIRCCAAVWVCMKIRIVVRNVLDWNHQRIRS